jgi:hypothetical protein
LRRPAYRDAAHLQQVQAALAVFTDPNWIIELKSFAGGEKQNYREYNRAIEGSLRSDHASTDSSDARPPSCSVIT